MKRTLLLIVFLLLWSCSDNDESHSTPPVPPKDATLTFDFESGSIGEVVHIDDYRWELSLKDDNNNPDLSDKWRNWWYVKIEKLKTDMDTEIIIKNRGWPYYYLPVYSYNQNEWFHFNEDEVMLDGSTLNIRTEFNHETVWIARHFPYTFSDLEEYIETISGNSNIDISTPGYSGEGKPLYLFKISDFSSPNTDKRRVLIHGRTHPAETPSSFLLEGLVDFLLNGSAESQELLAKHEFHIFPMQNVDGVIAGNYRTTTLSENLEVMWQYDADNPLLLIETTPPEIKTIHEYALNLMSDGDPKVSIALNLHAANGNPDLQTFFFPHFGTEDQGYAPEEASLWKKQISFMSTLAEEHGRDMFEPFTTNGDSSFAGKTYPESWWWVNFQDEVMAITMETTYGRSGLNQRWSEPEDFRTLGMSLARAIGSYDENGLVAIPAISSRADHTHFYPPFAEDELKE